MDISESRSSRKSTDLALGKLQDAIAGGCLYIEDRSGSNPNCCQSGNIVLIVEVLLSPAACIFDPAPSLGEIGSYGQIQLLIKARES